MPNKRGSRIEDDVSCKGEETPADNSQRDLFGVPARPNVSIVVQPP
jgi:hypothetical protein